MLSTTMEWGSRRSLRTLVALLQRGLVSDGDLDESLDLIRAVFGVSGLVVSNEFTYQSWLRSAGDMGNWPNVYTRLAHTDTTVEEIKLSTPGEWFLIKKAEAFHHRTEVFEAFQKEGFQDAAIVRLPSIQRDHATMALYRPSGDPDYDEDDQELLALLSPLLARALANKSAQTLLKRGPRPAGEHQQPVADGTAYVTFPGGQVEWSKSAQKLWRSKLGDIGPRGWQRIEKALVWAARNRTGTTADAVRASRLLRDISVEFANVPPHPGESHRILALLFEEPEVISSDIDPTPRSAAEMLLSIRQREVARLIARGWQLPQIAAELDVSVETVRDYLRTVYERLGVSTRIELAQLLS